MKTTLQLTSLATLSLFGFISCNSCDSKKDADKGAEITEEQVEVIADPVTADAQDEVVSEVVSITEEEPNKAAEAVSEIKKEADNVVEKTEDAIDDAKAKIEDEKKALENLVQ